MSTVNQLVSTARVLWRTSPYWKWTAVGGGVLTTLTAINGLSGGGTSAPHPLPQPTPTPQGSSYGAPAPAPFGGSITPIGADPAADQALSDYQIAHDAAMTVKEDGLRCEQIQQAFKNPNLTDKVKNRGRQLPNRVAAINDGMHCLDQLKVSDAHFAALTQAVAAAEREETTKTVQAVIDAFSTLDGFDQSRSVYKTGAPLIQKAKTFAGMLTASDARISTVSHETETFTSDQSAQAYIRVADAVQKLTPFDRGRLDDAQKSMLAIAERAAGAVRDARSHFAALPELLAAGGEPLVAAVAKVSSFDQAVATQEQKQLFDRARLVAIPLGWSLFQKRVESLSHDSSGEAIQAVAGIYGVLKDVPSQSLTAEQVALLAKGREAAERIAVSDAHLNDLSAAAAEWEAHGPAAGESVLAPLRAVTSFDQSRFTAAQKNAWTTLSQAELILRGSSIGLTAATKDKVRILVEGPTVGTQVDNSVVSALQTRLSAAGFIITSRAKDAALHITIAVHGVDPPEMDTSGAFVAYLTKAHLQVAATWLGDETQLFATEIDGVGRDQDGRTAQTNALSAAVNNVVARFKELTAK